MGMGFENREVGFGKKKLGNEIGTKREDEKKQ